MTLSFVNIGCDYCMKKFTNIKDYNYAMINGPLMHADNYLMIREKRVLNFVPEEDNITYVIAWVYIYMGTQC